MTRSSDTLKLVDLAIGTHVVSVNPKSNLTIVVTSATGTANIAYTFDPERPLDDGVAAPSTAFATGVVSRVWSTGASADAQETLDGPITGVLITVAVGVASVVLAPH